MMVSRSAGRNSRSLMPPALFAVHAHGVDFVEVSQGIIFVGEVADRRDGSDIAVHRIDAFERDQLGRFQIVSGEQLLRDDRGRCGGIHILAAAVLDHRRSMRRD